MHLKRTSLILALALTGAIALTGIGLPSTAYAANDYYASCSACHPLPLLQAQGDMGGHGGWGPPPPGLVDDACTMQCHTYTPPEGHDWPADGLFYWQDFLDPFSYPPGPSVSQQMCAQCHPVGFPPLDSLHTHDQIPYLPSVSTPPPSVLPLYQGDGPWNQDPNTGGLVCSTCHDPHDPSYVASSNNKQSYLRVGDPSGDITPLCETCHDTGQPTLGYDLYIDSDPLSVWFGRSMPDWVDVQVIVRNRGNIASNITWMEIQVDDGIGFPFPVDNIQVPAIPADSSVPVWFGIPDSLLWEGDEVVHFVLEPSLLNPVRNNTFVRSFAVPPAPENLHVLSTDYESITISWDPPLQPGPLPERYDVYRNGMKITPVPLEYQTIFTDSGLPPETPHTYTVTSVSEEGISSPMSNRVGALTDWGLAQIRVPQDYPTIQGAVAAASPGTTILVAPGTYSEYIDVNAQQIAIKGQDANVCTLDLTFIGPLDMTSGWGNSLSGFTIKGGEVLTTPLDTISQCVFQGTFSPSIRGGGFVTNSIFENTSGPVIELWDADEQLTVANSIFMSDYPFQADWPEEQLYLIHNAFPNWSDWMWLPGENNNPGYPSYTSPGPPDRYFMDAYPPFWNGGADVGLPFVNGAPDIGVFEIGMTYTAKPPTSLTATPMGPTTITLDWSPSPDEDIFSVSYEIYKSEWPDFPGSDDEFVYDYVNPGITTYNDSGSAQGVTYYYRVRAFTIRSSGASNTASAIAGGSAPTAVDDSYSVDENTSLNVPAPGVTGNDTDPDGDSLWATLVGGPSFAQGFAFSPDGSFDYTPLPGYFGPDSFTYSVDDGVNTSNTATVSITINDVNDPPTAADDSFTVDAALSSHSLNVLFNDGDIEGDPLTVSYVWTPDRGGTAVSAGDHIDYQQTPGFTGVETFQYEISDGRGGFDTAIVTVTVANDPPTAVDDSYSVDEETLLTVGAPGVLGNDSDPDSNPLTALLDTGPANASHFVLNPDGSFEYGPVADFTGTDSFSYVAEDGFNFSNTAVVTITVNPINDRPVADDQAAATDEDTAGAVTLTASDVDGDPLTYAVVTGPANGTLSGTAPNLTYTPNADFNGADAFTFTANDGTIDSYAATVSITVNAVNDAPVADDQAVVTDEDVALAVTLTASDIDSGTLTYAVVAAPGSGTLSGTAPDLTYTPNADFNGSDSFTFAANDGTANSNIATVSITVNPLNDAPRVDNPGTQNSVEGEGLLLSVTFTDPDSTVFTYGATGLPPDLGLNPTTGRIEGFLTYESDGTYNVAYTVDDGIDPATVNFAWIVAVTNRSPQFTYHPPGPLTNAENDTVSYQFTAVDPDGDSVTYGGLNLPDGTFIDPVTGLLTGTISYDSAGYRDFGIVADDGSRTNTLWMQWDISNVNRLPSAADNTYYEVDEDQVFSIGSPGVLVNDIDPDGDPLTAVLVDDMSNGTLALSTNGAFVYTPDADFTGIDYFTYTANDGQGDSNVATVGVTVNPVNDAPTAVDDSYSVDEGSILDVPAPGLLGNDIDVDGDTLTPVLVIPPANGILAYNPDGSFTYTHDGSETTADSFLYRVSDGTVNSNNATVSITVNPVNDASVADDQAVATDEDTAVAITLTASDVDGDPLTYAVVTGPSSGTLSGTAPNLSYTPDADYNGSDSFTFTANDGTVDSNTATVSITVNATNDAPVADDQTVATDEDSALGITLTASDTDGDTLTYAVTAGPSNGVLSGTAPNLTYTPNADFNGSDSFTFTASDGTVDSNTATVSITVNATNDAPVLQAIGPQAVAEAGTLSIALAASDVDGDGLSFSAVGMPTFCTLTDGSDGTGHIDCTPGYDDAGTYPITVTVTDDYSTPRTDSELFDLTVTGTNQAPTASDDAVVTDEDTVLAIALAASDLDGDSLTYAVGTGPSSGTLTGTAPNLTYTPNADFNGSDSFTFTANDGSVDSNTATVSITVNAINDAPAADDQAVATDEDTAAAITLTASDVDGDTLTYTVTGGPSNGTLSGTAPNLTYTPDANYNGPDSITFTANDGTVDSNTATVSITVNTANDAPVADDQAAATDEDTAVAITLTASDLDGDSLTYAVVTGPSNGSLSGTAPNLTYTPNADFNGADSFTFTANDGSVDSNTATVSITVNAINDTPTVTNPGTQNDSEGDTLSLQVAASDAESDTLSYSASGLPSGLSIDPGTGLISGTLTYDSAGSHGVTVSVSDGTEVTDVLFDWNVTNVLRMHVDDITTGAYVNRGKTYYTARVLVLDDGGAPLSGADVTAHWTGSSADGTPSTLSTAGDGTATFETNGIKKPSGIYVITIDDVVKSGYLYDIDGSDTSGQYPPPAQSAPVANGDSYGVDEGAQLIVPAPGVLGNDTDADSDPLTAVLAGGPAHGSLNLNADGSFTYTHDGSETTTDSFTYRANDGTVDSNTATVTIAVNPVNDAPTAADDSASTQQDTAVIVDVLANDSDPDGDTLTVSAVTQGANGSVANNGSDVTYTPNSGYTGPDSFTYTADDGNSGTDSATVSITVFAQNDPPTAVDDSAVTDEDTAVVVDVIANDSDPDSDPLTVSAVTQGANGSVANNGTDVTYSPDPDFHGSDSFTYTADDGNGGTDIATVSVTVNSVNDAPAAAADSAATDENTAVIVDVLANDSDADGDALTVLSVTQGAGGTVVNNGSDVTYTPNSSYIGDDTFTYTVDDGNGGTDTATVSVTVSPSSLPPVADAGPDQSGAKRENLTFDGSGSYDTGGTIVSWEWDFGDNKTGSGEVVVHKFTKRGTYTVTLTVTDDQGAQDTDTAEVTIN